MTLQYLKYGGLQKPNCPLKSDKYLLVDKGYVLERHVVVPFKEPHSRRPKDAKFNYQRSIPRVKNEYTFGVLKVWFPTLFNQPLHVGEDLSSLVEDLLLPTLAESRYTKCQNYK